MPKSRRRGRHLPRGKRRKERRGALAPATQPSAAQPAAVSQRYEPTPRAEMLAPSAKAPTPRATVTPAQPPDVAAELRRIGILSGIIVAILIVLSLFFS